MDTNDMMESCMSMMGSMMDGGMMGVGGMVSVVLGLLFFLVVGLALVGGLGYVAVRRLRA
jgi:hypothetical protein